MTRTLLGIMGAWLGAWGLVSFGCGWGGGDTGNQEFNDPGDDAFLDTSFGVTPDERFVVGAIDAGSDAWLHFVDTTDGKITELAVTSDDDKRVVFGPDGKRAWFMAQPSSGTTGETWTLIDLDTLQVARETSFPAVFWGTRLTTDGALFAVACDGVLYVIDSTTMEYGTIEPPSGAHDLFEADWIPGTHRLVASWIVYEEFGEARRLPLPARRVRPDRGWSPDGGGPMMPPVDSLELDRRWLTSQGTQITAHDIDDVGVMPAAPVRTAFVADSHPAAWWGFGLFGMHPDGDLMAVPLETFDTGSSWWGRDSLLVLDAELEIVTRVAGRGPVGYTSDGHTLVAYDFTDHGSSVDEVFLMLYDTRDFDLTRVELTIGIPAYYITPDGGEILLYSYWDIFSTGHENGLLLYDTASGETRHLDDSAGRHVNQAVITPEGDRIYFVDWTDSWDDWYGLYTIDLAGADVDRVPVDFRPYNINILPSHGMLVMTEYAAHKYYFLGLDSWSVEMYVDAR